jgi:hypothetical protein
MSVPESTFTQDKQANELYDIYQDLDGIASGTTPVSILDAYQGAVTAGWSSATPVNSVSQVNTQGYDTVIVTLVTGGSHSGGSVAFEVYDGAAWIPVKSPSVSDYSTTQTTTLTANMSKGYQIPVAGFPAYRSRLVSAPTSGTLTITTIVSSAPDTSIVTVGLDPGTYQGSLTPVNGALTANTSTAVLAANTATRYLFLQNNSASVIYLAFGTAATANNGIQIPANGGSMVFEASFLVTQSINLLSVPGTSVGSSYALWYL